MLNFDLYAIYTEKNERDGSVDELFSSFEEAMQHRMKYSNWWREKGNVWIKKFPAKGTFAYNERWLINADGTVAQHYSRKLVNHENI